MVSGITLINLFIVIIFLVQIIGQYLIWLYWLQVKEYRFDRFLIFLKSKEGKKELLIFPIIIKYLLIATSIFVDPFFSGLLLIVIILIFLYFLRIFFTGQFRRPIFTQRIKNISLVSFVPLILLIYYLYPNYWLVITEMGILLLPLIGVLITGISVKQNKLKEMFLAQKKLEKLRPTTIGITGSYGKTTTKDFLTQLMSTKYKVLSTYKNQNTHFGIIRRINNDLKKDHKYFICEIGAYKKGEIKEIAKILKPKVAIITGIEPQHLELFGNITNLKDAKFELIESLSYAGKAFFNLNSDGVVDLHQKARALNKNLKIYAYSVNKKGNFDAVSFTKNVSSKGIDFMISIKNEKKLIKTNIYSDSLIENLTGAILVARMFGVDWNLIKKVCLKLNLPEGTLNVYKTKNNVSVIDDSYNSSYSGFKSALSVLTHIKGKNKYVITTGIIELGDMSYVIHKKLAEEIKSLANKIVLKGSDFEKPFKDGLKDNKKLFVINNQNKIVKFLEKEIVSGDVVLLEGRMPQVSEYLRNI